MPEYVDSSPLVTVWLFKTIDRHTLDGVSAASTRYQGKDPYIDLTPFLGEGSAVRTSKSVREPAGAWSVTFADRPHKDWASQWSPPGFQALESVYGLCEPMDVIEIRMWNGKGGIIPEYPPIVMRGFVSSVRRGQAMSEGGKPVRTVTISGQDYGKIWQIFQVLYLPAYAQGTPLLTNFALSELFGVQAVNSMPAGEFIKTMIDKIINPFLAECLPDTLPSDVPKQIKTDDTDILVKHGTVNMSQKDMSGVLYSIMSMHGDVGVWNELYIEDREDGVHCVYRPIPALHITAPQGGSRKIQDDAPDPVYVTIPDSYVVSIESGRSDSNVANFFWVNNSKFDLISDMSRKLAAVGKDTSNMVLSEYPNSAVKYYAVRPMYAETQQGGDEVKNQTSGQPKAEQDARDTQQESWIDKRRRLMVEMNKDNVVFETGTLRVKGGPMRPGGQEAMKAGDYVRVVQGDFSWDAYVVQIEHEFMPYQGYFCTLYYERGEGFVNRISMEGSSESPWLVEQASRWDNLR